ncbi:MAG: 5'-nucleotidase C-terminal domain-containing protein [Bacteroidales bacterium]|nr:5'-nucleotidase C-terminal domain-containing protein [Bacteroidales bacterium]MCM1416007.1 5'-nucleotidase C-terminal domain-containing protein [bacterium]MCM1424920.1 5'-nucleotidase C-terminal domain-containing protein [bacterium]
MKKCFSLFLAAALFMTMLSGCGGENGKNEKSEKSGREQVTVALWSDQLTERYAPYLQKCFPEVDFTFYVATNSTDFYRFKKERGDLPDILTVRRFALRDVADWKDALLDLSDTELASTFATAYLRTYAYQDGTVNWLPACAEVDGILVNRNLLEEKGLSLPENEQEFEALCGTLQEMGIRPFASNFGADYTCMEVLQGLSVETLTSQAGREWRQLYESGQTDRLDEAVWLPVFERMQAFIAYAGIDASDLEKSDTELFQSLADGETAMIRTTPNETNVYGMADDCLLLPYFGETAESSWYLTYPAFQVAAGVRGTEDPARKELILDIMAAMLNEEGLKQIASDETLVAYNKDVPQILSPLLAPMEEHAADNRLYIRLASADMFSISQKVVQGMISGAYPDARSAFDAFNAEMGTAVCDTEKVVHLDTEYPYAFDLVHGSQAASAVFNSLREEVGTQLLVGPAEAVAGNVKAGDYTQEELNFLTMGESPVIVLCKMTGEQLYQYMEYVLTAQEKRGSVANDSTLYVASGFEMTVRSTDTGYELTELTVDGKELNREAVYSVALLGNLENMMEEALQTVGVTEYEQTEAAYQQIVTDRLAGGEQLAAPTDYIILR